MVQEKFWYPKEIDLKYTFFNLLLIFNLVATATPSEELNSFFNNELTFIQTSFNKFDKTYDRSEGSFVRNDDNSVRIDINYPFREIYFLNDDGIETHDLEFNQVKFIPVEQTNNNFYVRHPWPCFASADLPATNKVFNKMYKTTPTGTHYPRGIVQELLRPSAQPPARCSGYQSRNQSCC